MNDPTAFNALCDLWTSHFNIMLTCVTILAGLFGLGCPLMFSMFQRQNLKDERERLNKEMAEKFGELEERRANLERDMTEKFAELDKQRELIAQHDLRINELQTLSSDVCITAAQFYVERCHDTIKRCPSEPSKEKKKIFIGSVLMSIHNALNCGMNSKKQDVLIDVMNELLFDGICKFIFDDPLSLEAAVNDVKQDFSDDSFVNLADLVEVVGGNNATYLAFAKKYKPLFDAFG